LFLKENPRLNDQTSTQKQKRLNVKQVKIMPKNIEDKEDNEWALQLGFYPGIVIGFRTYHNEDTTIHVLYVPFIDIALIIPN
jgi:hypothetical protein